MQERRKEGNKTVRQKKGRKRNEYKKEGRK
jgi:hypothetical protein